MNCSELESFLYPYLDGEFDELEKLEVENHLAQCEVCAHRIHQEGEFQLQLKHALKRSAESQVASLALRRRVTKGWAHEQRRAVFHTWTRLGAVAATVVVLGSAIYIYWKPILRQQYVEEAVAHHAKRLPMEIQHPSPQQIATWFGGKLNHPVHIPKLAKVVPTGGRLLNVKDKQAAYIRYDTSQQTNGKQPHVGLFVFEDLRNDVNVGASPVRISSHGYQVLSWREGDVVYQLVTDVDELDAQHLMEPNEPTHMEPLTPTPTPSLEIRPATFHSPP